MILMILFILFYPLVHRALFCFLPSVCLTFWFTLDSGAGFAGMECLFPYTHKNEAL